VSPKRIPGLWKKAEPPVRLAWVYAILILLALLAAIVWGIMTLVTRVA
jgi:hypothetical protein